MLQALFMSVGRVGVYLLILAVSLGSARYLTRRQGTAGATASPVPSTLATLTPTSPSVIAPAVEEPSVPVPPRPVSSSADEVLSEALCPPDMTWIGGETCGVHTRRCSREEGGVCRAFEPSQCRPGQKLRACMDRYEYPNQVGMLPAVVVTFAQARMACEAHGKRLCTETEWAFGCEGPSGLAYPYGNELDPDACNVGHVLPKLPVDALWEARDVGAAVARSDARRKSGEGPRCVSPFAAFDLVGNAEEWVASDSGYHGALRGGGDGDAAPNCRSVRQMRDPSYRSVVTGFRCCRDPLVRTRGSSAAG